MKIINIFQYALKARSKGKYNTMEQRFHLDHLINIGHKQTKLKSTKQTKGVKHASK